MNSAFSFCVLTFDCGLNEKGKEVFSYPIIFLKYFSEKFRQFRKNFQNDFLKSLLSTS